MASTSENHVFDMTQVDGQLGYQSVYRLEKVEQGMDYLRQIFPGAYADVMNFCLFSTSGVHGSYQTIEDSYRQWRKNEHYTSDNEHCVDVTFLVIKPRVVTMIYGNCRPWTEEDYLFLRRLRASSMRQIVTIGTDPEYPPWR